MTPKAFFIRPMKPADMHQVLRLESQVFKTPWSRASVSEELASHHTCICIRPSADCQPEQIVGYLFFRLIFEEMQVLRIAVDPMSRRQGIATRLLDQGARTAIHAGVEKIILEVGSQNAAGLLFYRQAGFRQIGERPNYYAHSQEDALILMKPLKHKEMS